MLAFVVLSILILPVSCGTKKENQALKAEIEKLKKENESLKSESQELTISVDAYRAFLAEIDNNLRAIDENSTMVGELQKEISDEGEMPVEQRIKDRMAAINELIANSRLKILTMDKNLNKLRKTSAGQSEEILKLNQDLKKSIQYLMTKEAAFNELKASLNEQMELREMHEAEIVELKDILDRAFVFSGTSKILKEKGVIEKEGGFIGLGRVKIVNANSPDALFTRISKDNTDSLTFNSAEIKLISEHPDGSYRISQNPGGSVLYLEDKAEFWRQGNYLVVEVGK